MSAESAASERQSHWFRSCALGKKPLFPWCFGLNRLAQHSDQADPHKISTRLAKMNDVGDMLTTL